MFNVAAHVQKKDYVENGRGQELNRQYCSTSAFQPVTCDGATQTRTNHLALSRIMLPSVKHAFCVVGLRPFHTLGTRVTRPVKQKILIKFSNLNLSVKLY